MPAPLEDADAGIFDGRLAMTNLTAERIFVARFHDGPVGVQTAFGVNDDRRKSGHDSAGLGGA